MAPRLHGRHLARAFRRALSVGLWAVAVAAGLTTIVSLGSITLWALLYCAVKPWLECGLSLLVLSLWWGTAVFGVGLAVVGARRLWGRR